MKKVTIIGHFGGNTNMLDGQTIKTKILYSELKERTDWKIYRVDTYYRRHNPFRLLWDSCKGIVGSHNIIVLLSKGGMRIYFPILYYVSKWFHKNIFHDVIGGKLPEYVRDIPGFHKYISNFKHNWVETETIKKALEAQGIYNCTVVPNFKNISVVPLEQLECHFDEPFRFCTFSRVIKEKGIEDAVNAVDSINKKYGRTVCELDIYGYIDKAYEKQFESFMMNKTASHYCGLVDYDKSVEVISSYYALLFPTYWKGEGFPGTLVDALSAGLPVIASDWNFNKDIIKNGETGILFPSELASDLESAMCLLMEKKNIIGLYKQNCVHAAEFYGADRHMKYIIQSIQAENGIQFDTK